MTIHRSAVLFVCLSLIISLTTSGLSQPPPVPRVPLRQLDEASYVQLAKEWKEYIEKNGESAEALVNLARAYDYSGELDAAVIAAKRAVELEPNHPKALAFYGSIMSSYIGDVEGSLELLERCRQVAPDYEYGLTVLATSYMRLGELAKADEVFATIFKERTIPRPLQDYAYNMLVGLPQGAVLLTYGDNDTYPPLALQAGLNFRKDVAVINMSMLNVVKYDEALFKRYPSIKPKGKIEHDHVRPLHMTLIERIVAEQKAPVFFASSTNFDFVGFTPDLFVEGLNLRTSEEGLSAEESARLLLETYRMDSVTDWNVTWALMTSVSEIMMNYVIAMIKVAKCEDVTKETKLKLLEKALEIAKFHNFERMLLYIEKSIQKK